MKVSDVTTREETSQRIQWDRLEQTSINEVLSAAEFEEVLLDFRTDDGGLEPNRAQGSLVARSVAALAGTDWNCVVSRTAARQQVFVGVLVLMSSALAGVCAGVIAALVTDASLLTTVVSGSFIALVVALLDRNIVGSLSSERLVTRWLRALPRLVIAFALAWLFSSAVLLLALGSDVELEVANARIGLAAEAAETASGTVIPSTAPLELELADVERQVEDQRMELEVRRAEVEGAEQLLFDEVLGVPGEGTTGTAGRGPLASSLQDALDRSLTELDETEGELSVLLVDREVLLERLTETRIGEAVEVNARAQDASAEILTAEVTLFERLAAFDRLADSERQVELTSWLLTLLVFLVGAAPAMVTLQRPSSHDMLRLEHDMQVRRLVSRRAALDAGLQEESDLVELFAQQRDSMDAMGVPPALRKLLSGFPSDADELVDAENS